jgi:hypothetical protein
MQRIKLFILFGAPLLSFVPLRGEVIVKDLERLELFTINSKPHTMCRNLNLHFISRNFMSCNMKGKKIKAAWGEKGILLVTWINIMGSRYFVHIWTSATSIFRAENNLQQITSRCRILDFTRSPDIEICWFEFYGLFWNSVIIVRPIMWSPSELQQLPKNMKNEENS